MKTSASANRRTRSLLSQCSSRVSCSPGHGAGLVLLVTLLLTSCGEQGICGAVGSPPTAVFVVSRILANESGLVRVHACLETACTTTRLRDPKMLDGVHVNDPSLASERTVELQLSVEDESGHSLFDSTGVAQLHRVQPNGPDCPPTTYATFVTVTRAGHFRERPAPYS